MKNRFLLKLVPVALVAAFALVLSARSTPRADASVSGLSPSTFVVNAGSPVGFSFTAQAGAGNITITSSSSAVTFISPSCAGCAVSGNGTSSVTIVPPQGTSAFLVSFSLDVACTAPGLPITVTASQGNTMTAFGTTGNCAPSCVSAIYGCCNVVASTCNCTTFNNCGCLAVGVGGIVTNSCACGANLLYPNCTVNPAQVSVQVPLAPVVQPQPVVQVPAQVVAQAPVQVQAPVVQQPVLPRAIAPPNTGDGGCLASGC